MNLAAVHLDNLPTDEQAQPEADAMMRAVRLEEALEDVVALGARNAESVVTHHAHSRRKAAPPVH